MAGFKLDSKQRKFKSTWYANVLGTSFLVAIIIDLYYINLYHAWGVHMLFKIFGSFQGLTRLYMTVVHRRPIDTPSEGAALDRQALSRFCPICKINVPSKDHHCWFLSTCISKVTNHGDFCIFIFWAFIGSLYTLIFHLAGNAGAVVADSTWMVLMLPGGILATILGYISFSQLISLVRLYAYLAGGMFCFLLNINYLYEHCERRQKFWIFQQDFKSWVKILLCPWVAVGEPVKKNL